MAKDAVYTNGVIAVRETSLLGGKILKLCESSAEDAFRTVAESGFGKGAEAVSVYEYEKLLTADERDIDAFIREYAPTNAEKTYLLSPRDFHNAKAILKAHYLGLEAENMLAPEGLISVDVIASAIKEKEYAPLGDVLSRTVAECAALFEDEEKQVSGAEIGAAFERAQFEYLFKNCSGNFTLKRLLQTKADMTNILTAFRALTPEYAAKTYVEGGKIKTEKLGIVFGGDAEKINKEFDGGYLRDFVRLCAEARENGLPYAEAELLKDSLETDYLAERKYELKRSQPFLYYVFRRRAENADLRIIFVCLLAGMEESAIKKRLRAG